MRALTLAALAMTILVLGGSLLVSIPTARAGPSVPSAGSRVGWINISAVGQYGYSPANLQQVPTNATITVTFTDQSDMAHTFTILGREGWVVPTSYAPAQIDKLAYGSSPKALDNANVSGPGDVNVTTFESPGPGWYEFICTTSGHFQQGMYGFVAFGMNLPTNLTPTNRTTLGGPLSFSVLDAVLLVVGAVIGASLFMIWRLRRNRTLPPEAQR
jgi:plastocyanin